MLDDWVQAAATWSRCVPTRSWPACSASGPRRRPRPTPTCSSTRPAPGAGIPAETMQFHGARRPLDLDAATTVATLLPTGRRPPRNPAVTLRDVGGRGPGRRVHLRPGAVGRLHAPGQSGWAGQERDGKRPKRSDDLFFGAGDDQPDWVDLDKVTIPQADEQQRLLANLITQMSADRMPLPRFWYLPRGEKAAVVMTGDDHGTGGTPELFDSYKAATPPAARSRTGSASARPPTCTRTPSPTRKPPSTRRTVSRSRCTSTPGCADFTPALARRRLREQLTQFASSFPSLAAPRTNRTHCIVWSDWAARRGSSSAHGVRLDTNYYYWPAAWVRTGRGCSPARASRCASPASTAR